MNTKAFALGICMLLSGYCGIVAELSLFTLAESLIGSTLSNLLYTMGIMMFFMGVGSWFMSQKFAEDWSYGSFITLELTLSLAVCTSIPSLTFLCGSLPQFSTGFFIVASAIIGFLIGMEIPLMQKLLQSLTDQNIQAVAGKIMMADYFGGLLGFTLFSMVLLFKIGLPWTAYSSGWLNGFIAILVSLNHLGVRTKKGLSFLCCYIALLSWIGFNLDLTMDKAEKNLYRHPIVLQKQTPYQKMTLTNPQGGKNQAYELAQNQKMEFIHPIIGQANHNNNKYEWRKLKDNEIAFYINGGLQFHSSDEYIYHEHLVHPSLLLAEEQKNILIMGAGDGLALREVVKHKSVQHITLVELDPGVIELFTTEPKLRALNNHAFDDPRLNIVYDDAWTWARQSQQSYNVVILDFPDPHHIETTKLYSLQFYRLLKGHMSKHSCLVTQATSPLYSSKSFLCIKKTLEEAGFDTMSLHIEMPSFAQWGFHLASSTLNLEQMKHKIRSSLPKLNFDHHLDSEGLTAAWSWSKKYWDPYSSIQANDFYNYILLQYYQTP